MNQKRKKRNLIYVLSFGLLLATLQIGWFNVFPHNHLAHSKRTMLNRVYKDSSLRFELQSRKANTSLNYISRNSSYVFSFGARDNILLFSKADDNARGKFKALNLIDTIAKQTATIDALRLNFISANSKSLGENIEKLKDTTNYLIGTDQKKWLKGVPRFAKVAYRDIYQGIDVFYHGNQGELRYDFVVAPNADASQIKFKFEGAVDKIEINQTGDLVLHLGDRYIIQRKPLAYQNQNGVALPVEVRYAIDAKNQISFVLGNYNKKKPLMINPVLVYSSYFGGSDEDTGTSIAVDSFGNQYIVGSTLSADLPDASNRAQTFTGKRDIYVAKVKADGSGTEYVTYIGGFGDDEATGIAVDNAGQVYITGTTSSLDFPTTSSSFQSMASNGTNAFVAKLSADGSRLIYSSYLGGNGDDEAYGIALDGQGNAYVTGITDSTDFPTTNAFQSSKKNGSDAFITKFKPNGAELSYSSYIGGNGADWGLGIAVDSSGNAYVTGVTASADLPVINALQSESGGNSDAFVLKIKPSLDGSESLQYLTYIGGSATDGGLGIAVDENGAAYVTGVTRSKDFPATKDSLRRKFGGESDAFIFKLNQNGNTLDYATLIGGRGRDVGFGIAVNANREAYIVGSTTSPDLPLTAGPLQATFSGKSDGFISKLNSEGNAVIYSTYFGGNNYDDVFGLALDSTGDAYITGATFSPDFAVTNGVAQIKGKGMSDAFFVKLSLGNLCSTSLSSIKQTFKAEGGTGVISITAPQGCRWQVMSDLDWLTVSSGTNGAGNGTVNFFVQPNSGGSIRNGVIIVAGKEFAVTQKAGK